VSEDSEYTVADGADDVTVAAIYRCTLVAQRPRLSHIDIDLISDMAWPDGLRWAVDAGHEIIRRRRDERPRWWHRWIGPGDILRVDPRDDEAFEIAVALAPYTIGGTGLDDQRRFVWSGNDTGTSAVFGLTDSELETVRAEVFASGGDPRMLVPFEPRKRRR
jgi:hypothetical protein